ncbi:MAG TPA: hypothetical protein VJO52_05795 [Gemmatimonadaceae bacterium]|nr:hypothetical protein [Gemmatimonadaceae bacterium]
MTNDTESDPLRLAVDAAAAFFLAIDARQWESAARCVDPDAAERFRDVTLRALSAAAGVSTLGNLAGLTPTQFVARSLEYRDAQWNDRNAPAAGPTRDVLGATTEGESYVQVLYRPNEWDGGKAGPVPVLVLRMRHRDGQWLVDLEHTDHALVSPMIDDDDTELSSRA